MNGEWLERISLKLQSKSEAAQAETRADSGQVVQASLQGVREEVLKDISFVAGLLGNTAKATPELARSHDGNTVSLRVRNETFSVTFDFKLNTWSVVHGVWAAEYVPHPMTGGAIAWQPAGPMFAFSWRDDFGRRLHHFVSLVRDPDKCA